MAIGLDKIFGVADVCGLIGSCDRMTLEPFEEQACYEARKFSHGAVCLGGDPFKQPKIATTSVLKLLQDAMITSCDLHWKRIVKFVRHLGDRAGAAREGIRT